MRMPLLGKKKKRRTVHFLCRQLDVLKEETFRTIISKRQRMPWFAKISEAVIMSFARHCSLNILSDFCLAKSLLGILAIPLPHSPSPLLPVHLQWIHILLLATGCIPGLTDQGPGGSSLTAPLLSVGRASALFWVDFLEAKLTYRGKKCILQKAVLCCPVLSFFPYSFAFHQTYPAYLS